MSELKMSWENSVLTAEEKLEKISKVESIYRMFLLELGLDVDNDENLKGTPHRVAKMYVNELMHGNNDPLPKMTSFKTTKMELDENNLEPVLIGPCEVKSLCSHHFMPFIGHAFVEIIQGSSIIGISKIPRLVKWISRRPHLQEKLTDMIVEELIKIVPDIKGIAVYVKAQHTCMSFRGVESSADMVTTASYGIYKKEPTRFNEFRNACERKLITRI